MRIYEWNFKSGNVKWQIFEIILSVKSSKANEDNREILVHKRNFRARNSRRYESDLRSMMKTVTVLSNSLGTLKFKLLQVFCQRLMKLTVSKVAPASTFSGREPTS